MQLQTNTECEGVSFTILENVKISANSRLFLKQNPLVAEVTRPREAHHQPQTVDSSDHFIVAH